MIHVLIIMDQSSSYSQYYDCEFHSGPFIADRTGSKLLVGESNSESDKCDDGRVVLHKTARPFESGNDSEIPETLVKVSTEKVTSTDKVSKSYVYWSSFKFSIAAVFY